MGESSLEGALREVKEEVGIDLQPEAGRLLFSKVRDRDVEERYAGFNDIMDAWLFLYDGEYNLNAATTDEVADCKWLTALEIRVLYERNKLVPHLNYFFDTVARGLLYENLSSQYRVRALNIMDIDAIFTLCSGNELFYRYHPPFVTKESIWHDMNALPPEKAYRDKFYIGFLGDTGLTAIMDLIIDYPSPRTAFIGLFMMAKPCQGKGIGSAIFCECAHSLSKQGFQKIRLAIDKGNPQSEAFWRKNGFLPTGEEISGETFSHILMERPL